MKFWVRAQQERNLSNKKEKRSGSKPSTKKRKLYGDAEAVNGRAESSGTVKKTESSAQASALPQLEEALKKEKEEPSTSSKPYFNITGDENWDDSDEEGDDAGDQNGEGNGDEGADDEEEEEEEDQDDFSLAYEILDVARVLLLRKLETVTDTLSKQPESTTSTLPTTAPSTSSNSQHPSIRLIKTRLADVHDLQAEINLENELYPAAVTDLRSNLELTEQLWPFESNLIAECHYKLSLALEFASATQARDAAGNPTGTADHRQSHARGGPV